MNLAKIRKYLGNTYLPTMKEEYLAFLTECKNTPKKKHKPTKLADIFWHAHILHTKKYEKDCIKYFGYYLHHTPAKDNCDDDGCGV